MQEALAMGADFGTLYSTSCTYLVPMNFCLHALLGWAHFAIFGFAIIAVHCLLSYYSFNEFISFRA